MTAEKIEEAISDAISLGAQSVSLSGGEPFLHPDILRIVEYIHQKNVSCHIYTSGIIFQEGKPVCLSDNILRAIKGKADKLIFNVEAADEQTYDQIMGTSFGGFHLMKTSIKRAVSLGIQVEAHVVPMKLNLQDLPRIMTLCNDLGISRVSFLRLVVQGRALSHKSDILLSEEDVTFAKYLITTSTKKYKGTIRFGIPFGDCTNRINCMTGIVKLDIRYDGKVYPCEAFKNDNVGGLLSAEPDDITKMSLSDIYLKSVYLSQVRNLLKDFQSIDTCETCMNQYYRNK